MTLPLLLALHLAYGVLMAFAMERRMRAEGEVLGVPLLWTLLPVVAVSTPLGAVLLRWAGGWFLHGQLLGEGSITYERFHLGLMVGVGLAAGLCTVLGMFAAIAALSRGARRLALVPGLVALALAVGTLATDAEGVVELAGTRGRMLWAHPAGLVSLALVLSLLAAWAFARARLSVPADVRA